MPAQLRVHRGTMHDNARRFPALSCFSGLVVARNCRVRDDVSCLTWQSSDACVTSSILYWLRLLCFQFKKNEISQSYFVSLIMYSFHRKINNASSLSKWICFNLLFESEYRYTVHWVCISSTLHRLCIYRYNKQRSVYCLDSYYADVLLNTINIEYKNWKKLINYLWLFPITFHYNRKVLCNINKGNNGTGGLCFFYEFLRGACAW